MPHLMGDFQISDRLMRYSDFIPRFYNLCRSYGFEAGRIMPSRAFCSDESQGFPIILITKHFGTFPFNHGRVGGIVATGRHGPHAHHGQDLALIQASHVGYDPEKDRFGIYRRLQTEDRIQGPACGKIQGVLSWYRKEYAFARENIAFSHLNGDDVVIVDNQLLDPDREAGLFPRLEALIDMEPGTRPGPLTIFSTSKAFPVNRAFKSRPPAEAWKGGVRAPIGDALTADLFHFKRPISNAPEGSDQLELNLSYTMPQIVTAQHPELTAAQTNTQLEFDRTYRSIIKEREYGGKNLAFISGINIDVSPREGQAFPLTKFVPWAAYIQTRDGWSAILEQRKLFIDLSAQSLENENQIDLEDAIRRMKERPALKIAP